MHVGSSEQLIKHIFVYGLVAVIKNGPYLYMV